MKIGFPCKFSLTDPKKGVISEEALNTKVTTVAWLKRQSKAVAEKKIEELVNHNLSSVHKLVERVGKQVEPLRMVRLSSDLLPVYTEPNFGYVYKSSNLRNFIESKLKTVGDLARKNNVRLSFHPGQFCVLGSSNPDVVDRSIEDFEYHADMARWMGYGASWHDHGFKINVHIAGRAGADGILSVLPKLSTEARNLITIENEEISYGLDDCLSIGKHVAVVLDIHHFWIREGNYIQPDDPRISQILDSWRGVRPTMHYSISREDLLVGHCPNTMPDLNNLLAQGHKKQKLRAHSDAYWNDAVNTYAVSFLKDFDIMAESKHKNLASFKLYENYIKPGVNK
jgi:UV DNA damage repair endonuclease